MPRTTAGLRGGCESTMPNYSPRLLEARTQMMDDDKKYWYLATCIDCQPILPQPFGVEKDRAEWVDAHIEGTAHTVILAVQERTI